VRGARKKTKYMDLNTLFHGAKALSGPGPPHYWGFAITLRHTTVGRNLRDEWSARRRDLYLTTHTTHKKQTTVPPAEFEPAIPASERPQTHTLYRAATGIGASKDYVIENCGREVKTSDSVESQPRDPLVVTGNQGVLSLSRQIPDIYLALGC
jgi:hypothetical protein